MKASYVRFAKSVMQPGPAGVQIDHAGAKSEDVSNSVRRTETVFDEIHLDFTRRIVFLTQTRRNRAGKPQQYQRLVPFENVVDMEELDEREEPPKKGQQR